jgi:hypothetical protein
MMPTLRSSADCAASILRQRTRGGLDRLAIFTGGRRFLNPVVAIVGAAGFDAYANQVGNAQQARADSLSDELAKAQATIKAWQENASTEKPKD